MRCWIIRRQWLSGIAIRLSGRCPRACATIRYSWISSELSRTGEIMADTTVYAGNVTVAPAGEAKAEVFSALCRLSKWLDDNDLSAYDPFDGLNAPLARLLTFHNKFLETTLQQGVRRFPLNLRPLLGIHKSQSTK